MMDVNQLVVEHLDLWTSAIEKKSSAGRGGGKAISLYGVAKLRELIFNLAAEGQLIEPDVEIAKTKLGEHVDLVMGQAPPGAECNKNGDGTVFVKTGEFGDLYPEVVEWTTKPLKLALDGDVLICVVGATIGKLNLAIDCAIGRSVAAIRPKSHLETRFLYYSLMPYTLRLRGGARGSAQGVIGKAELNAVKIRVPSAAEQNRIVAKVDELMGLCDALERQAEDSLKAHQTLVETCLATLTNSQSSEDLTQNWARIEANFGTLFTTEESVELLRSEIARLATRGIISEPSDDHHSADRDLDKSAQRKKILVAEGIVKERKYSAMPVKTSEPISYPSHWRTVTMRDLFAVTGGIQKTPARQPKSNAHPYLGVGNVYRNRIDLTNVKSFELKQGELERYALKSGDILIVEGNGSLTEIGRNAVWQEQIENCVHQNHLIRCRPYLPEVVPFVSLFLNSPDGMDEMARLAITSSGLYSLSVGKISQIEVPFPPITEQESTLSLVQELHAVCSDLAKNLASQKKMQVALSDALTSKIH